jgi:hypothetical protein
VSRAIQVRVSESVVRTIHVEDGVQAQLEVLPVLPADRMAELLAAELDKLGFVRSADGATATRTDQDGLEVTIDLRAATVTVKLGAGADLAESIEIHTRVAEETAGRTEQRIREDAVRKLEERIEEKTEQLRKDVTRTLEKKLGDLRAELDGAIGKTTVAALTERAAQLGTIEEIHADEAGNLTIKVKL